VRISPAVVEWAREVLLIPALYMLPVDCVNLPSQHNRGSLLLGLEC
jgi:hypothetical protein